MKRLFSQFVFCWMILFWSFSLQAAPLCLKPTSSIQTSTVHKNLYRLQKVYNFVLVPHSLCDKNNQVKVGFASETHFWFQTGGFRQTYKFSARTPSGRARLIALYLRTFLQLAAEQRNEVSPPPRTPTPRTKPKPRKVAPPIAATPPRRRLPVRKKLRRIRRPLRMVKRAKTRVALVPRTPSKAPVTPPPRVVKAPTPPVVRTRTVPPRRQTPVVVRRPVPRPTPKVRPKPRPRPGKRPKAILRRQPPRRVPVRQPTVVPRRVLARPVVRPRQPSAKSTPSSFAPKGWWGSVELNGTFAVLDQEWLGFGGGIGIGGGYKSFSLRVDVQFQGLLRDEQRLVAPLNSSILFGWTPLAQRWQLTIQGGFSLQSILIPEFQLPRRQPPRPGSPAPPTRNSPYIVQWNPGLTLSARVDFFLHPQWSLFARPVLSWYPSFWRQVSVDDSENDDLPAIPDDQLKRIQTNLSEFQFSLYLGIQFRF